MIKRVNARDGARIKKINDDASLGNATNLKQSQKKRGKKTQKSKSLLLSFVFYIDLWFDDDGAQRGEIVKRGQVQVV